ncbi:MAG: M13-type metalloendopeptidase [Buchananella hordeovulneris]|nr:M13-type metalloendopeptidase [Buchananella hordeovulneris]
MTDLIAGVLDPARMDEAVRPQDDLYRYVHGTWLREHEIPADRPMDGVFYALRDQSEEEVRAIIEECADLVAAGTATDAQERVGKLYASFMDEAVVEKTGAGALAADLDLLCGVTNHSELARAIGALQRTGTAGLVGFDAEGGFDNPNNYTLFTSQAGLGLPDEAYYREEKHAETLAAYRGHVARQLRNCGLAASDDEAARRSNRVVDFEIELAKGHRDAVKAREAELMNNPMTFAQLQEVGAGFDWVAFFDAYIDGKEVPDLLVMEPEYISHLGKTWEQTELSLLLDYATWHVVRSRSPYLNQTFVQENFEFYGKTLAGTQELRARWKRGVALVEGAIGEDVAQVYVAKHFPPSYKAAMQELVSNLIEAYRESISGLDWMGEETKARALEKLGTFVSKVGYPDKWRDFSALHFGSSLLANVRVASAFETDYMLSKVGKEIDPTEWLMTPQTVNAYYHPIRNEIVFPAAILRPPFFSPEADDAINYGAIGAVIGHEIGHGFDDQGSKFAGDGSLSDWWTAEDRAAFEERTRALIEQYNKFVPQQLVEKYGDEHHVNGALTIGENIGDLGGATIALKAYRLALAKAGVEGLENAPVIDGMTGTQRFFLSYARVWGSKARDEALIQQVATDPHSPAEFRANGIVANVDEFAQAFDVQPGDKLWIDPAKRVRIW